MYIQYIRYIVYRKQCHRLLLQKPTVRLFACSIGSRWHCGTNGVQLPIAALSGRVCSRRGATAPHTHLNWGLRHTRSPRCRHDPSPLKRAAENARLLNENLAGLVLILSNVTKLGDMNCLEKQKL